MTRLLAFLVAILSLAVAGCGGEEGYSEDVEETFMAECVPAAIEAGAGALSEDRAREYCKCSYDEIEAAVPFDEFAEYEEKSREHPETPLPPKAAGIARRCAASLR